MRTKLFCLLTLPCLMLLGGCKNTGGNANVGPALLRLGVSTAAGYAILQNPEAAPGVRAGAGIVCAYAHATNVSPAEIVAAINAYGELKPEAVFILNAAISAYSLTFNGLANTNAATASPYAWALCDGLNDALLLGGGANAASFSRSPNLLPVPDAAWPQVKF